VILQFILRFFSERSRRNIEARDLKRINAATDRLNSEAAAVLGYQDRKKPNEAD
jgi:hypothetical protein